LALSNIDILILNTDNSPKRVGERGEWGMGEFIIKKQNAA
jgi:hypothetical protein